MIYHDLHCAPVAAGSTVYWLNNAVLAVCMNPIKRTNGTSGSPGTVQPSVDLQTVTEHVNLEAGGWAQTRLT